MMAVERIGAVAAELLSHGRSPDTPVSVIADGTMPTQRTINSTLEEVERAMVELAMRQANGNQTHAARLLDISRDALRYKLKKFELATGSEEESADALHPERSSTP